MAIEIRGKVSVANQIEFSWELECASPPDPAAHLRCVLRQGAQEWFPLSPLLTPQRVMRKSLLFVLHEIYLVNEDIPDAVFSACVALGQEILKLPE